MKYPKNGKFGEFGGRYIPETLVPAIEELEENYLKFKNDKSFKKELDYYLKVYAGRPTPLYYAKNLSESGIGTAEDIQYLKKSGADAFLIGSSIMKSDNIEEQVRKLVSAY